MKAKLLNLARAVWNYIKSCKEGLSLIATVTVVLTIVIVLILTALNWVMAIPPPSPWEVLVPNGLNDNGLHRFRVEHGWIYKNQHGLVYIPDVAPATSK